MRPARSKAALGGRIFGRLADGTEVLWGEVMRWDPPKFVAFTWHPGQGPDSAQTLEVAFTAIDGGARIELTHSGWEKLGEKALETRNGYDSGWDIVFGERYAGWTEQEAASR